MKNKTPILILTDWYYPAYKAGGPITSLFNLCHFLKDHFQFYILTSNQDLDGKTLKDIETNQWVEGSNKEQIYYSSISLSKITLNNAIQNSNSKIIYLNSLFSFDFTIKPLWWLRASKELQIFLSLRGMLHQQAFSQKKVKKSIFLATIKKLSSFKKTTLIASNGSELKEIQKHHLSNQTIILPNIPKLHLLDENRKAVPQKVLTVVSRIAPEKNSLFAIECISKIKQNVTVNWIGDSIDAEFKEAFLKLIDKLPKNITFLFHEAQNASFIREALLTSKVFFLPTLGENFGHAIFEALATGTPAVIGLKTPFFEIESINAGFALDPKDINANLNAISSLLGELDSKWLRLSEAARGFAKESFDVEQCKKLYLAVWN